jgi:hypothetical protein
MAVSLDSGEQAPTPQAQPEATHAAATATTNTAAATPSTADVQKLRAMLAHGSSPADVAKLIAAHSKERDVMFRVLHQNRGNAYVQEVVAAMPHASSAPTHAPATTHSPTTAHASATVSHAATTAHATTAEATTAQAPAAAGLAGSDPQQVSSELTSAINLFRKQVAQEVAFHQQTKIARDKQGMVGGAEEDLKAADEHIVHMWHSLWKEKQRTYLSAHVTLPDLAIWNKVTAKLDLAASAAASYATSHNTADVDHVRDYVKEAQQEYNN